jgi:anti-sigma factor RsiW
MVCRDFEPFLGLYTDGELLAGEKLELEAHLHACPACARRVHAEARFRELMKKTQGSESTRAPEALRASIRSGLAHARAKESRERWARAAAAMAVAAAFAGAIAYYRPSGVQNFGEDAAMRHAKHLPFEIQRVNYEGMEAWFGGKLDHRVPVPRFPNAELAGARLSNVREKPAAYITYDASAARGSPKHRMGLFVLRDEQDDIQASALPAVRVSATHGYNVATWREGEIVYQLVSDLDESDIRQMLSSPSKTSNRQFDAPWSAH